MSGHIQAHMVTVVSVSCKQHIRQQMEKGLTCLASVPIICSRPGGTFTHNFILFFFGLVNI